MKLKQRDLPLDEIAARAKKIYHESGCIAECAVQNWLLAKAQLRHELGKAVAKTPGREKLLVNRTKIVREIGPAYVQGETNL